jgi:hypothetical protein
LSPALQASTSYQGIRRACLIAFASSKSS